MSGRVGVQKWVRGWMDGWMNGEYTAIPPSLAMLVCLFIVALSLQWPTKASVRPGRGPMTAKCGNGHSGKNARETEAGPSGSSRHMDLG